MPSGNRRALIATKDPLVAALLGLLVESAGFVAVFLEPDEEVGQAISRLRPVAATFLSVDLGEVRSDVFFAHLARSQTRVVVFGPNDRAQEIARVASDREIAWFILPPSAERIGQFLRALSDRRDGKALDRRSEPQARFVSNETSIFVDRAGVQWLVYDRRATTGRRGDADGVIDRTFVSELGETFSFPVEARLAADAKAATLERQLETAMVRPDSGSGE